jgi:hypothetical protein
LVYEWIVVVDGKGGNTKVMRIGRVRDAFHLVWWMTNIMHCWFALVLLAFVNISLKKWCSTAPLEALRQAALPELSLKAMMAYPDVKLLVSFVYRCLREAMPPQSRV